MSRELITVELVLFALSIDCVDTAWPWRIGIPGISIRCTTHARPTSASLQVCGPTQTGTSPRVGKAAGSNLGRGNP